MTRVSNSKALAFAGIVICTCAAFHLAALLIGGVHLSTLLFFPVGLIYMGFGRSYLNRSDLWVWPGLGFMIVGSLVVVVMLCVGSALPAWWLKPIFWLDIVTGVCLIWYLVRR